MFHDVMIINFESDRVDLAIKLWNRLSKIVYQSFCAFNVYCIKFSANFLNMLLIVVINLGVDYEIIYNRK